MSPFSAVQNHSSDSTPRQSLTRAEYSALALLCMIAALLRFWGLGSLGLEVDEGVQGLTVQGWLDSGLPVLPSGMMYRRAIPFGALQALAARAFGLNEFALRFPAALFGVLAVPVTFALARVLFDRRIAWTAAIFIALSAWEIELSRYARFYTAFQVTYGIALLCFFRAFTGGASIWRWGFVAAALAAITLHDLSIVLATCFLVPLLDRTASARTRATAVLSAVALFTIWLGYRRMLVPWFASLGPPHGLEMIPSATSETANTIPLLTGLPPLRLPAITGMQNVGFGDWLAIACSIAVALVAMVWALRRGLSDRGWHVILPVFALALGVTHQFMAVSLTLLVYLVLSATTLRSLWSRAFRPILAALFIMLTLWTLALYGPADGDMKALILALFGFPNLLQHFAYWFALGWPVFLVGIAVAALAMLERVLREGDRAMLYLLVTISAPMAVASMFDSYHESRYVFHLYPALVILFAWGLLQAADRLVTALRTRVASVTATGMVLATGFLLSGDVGPRTVAPMTRTHASHRDSMRSIISWKAFAGFHQDQVAPARFARERADSGDLVAAIGTPHQLAVYRYYVGRLDVALSRAENAGYSRLRNGRIIDWVTGAELVFEPKDLMAAPPGRFTWLLGDDVLLAEDVDYFPSAVRRDARALAAAAIMRGRDGVSFAAKLP